VLRNAATITSVSSTHEIMLTDDIAGDMAFQE
jgi:hypothetical protein